MDEGLIVKGLIVLLGVLMSLVGYLLKTRIDRAEKDIIERMPRGECNLTHSSTTTDISSLKHHKHASTGEVIL